MDLYRLLQKANLSSYYDAFLSNGGDDVHQLLEANEEELQEIMRVVDMANKPLHVIRLKKTLNDIRSRPEKYSLPSNGALFNDSQRNYSFQGTTSNNVSSVAAGNDWSSSSAAGFHATNSQVRGIPVNLLPNATLTENERMNIEMAADDLVKAIPEYPIKDHSPSRKGEAGLYEVIKMSADHASRVPAIYRYSAIYGRFNRPRKTGKAMNHHEVAVNEAAAQLCLRMPSLLSRREDLYPIARQVVKIAEAFWKSNYRSRSHKKKRSNPNVVAIANEFANYHKNNPQNGYLLVQEKIEVMKSQLYEMTMQQDKLRLAFRVAKSGAGGASMSEIQKEIDTLSGVQQGKIAELGRLVLELRKFRNELNLPQSNQSHHSNADTVITTSACSNLGLTHNLISLAPVQSGAAANIFAATAGGLTVFPGLTQVKSDSQNATFLINNPGRGNETNFVTASGNINNPALPIVTLPPGVMALNVANSHSQTSAVLTANSVASYVGANNNISNSSGLAAQFPNFSVFTNFDQIKAISAASINSASPQQTVNAANAADLMKIDNSQHAANVYQAYIA